MLVKSLPAVGGAPIGMVPPTTDPPSFTFDQNALLAGLSPEVFDQIGNRIKVVNLAADQILFAENDPGDCLYLIAQGSIKISKSGRGGQQETLSYLSANDYFGEMALIDGGKRSARATAVGQTVLGQIDRETWILLLHLAPQSILTNFTRSFAQRLRQNNQNFIEQMMRSERLSLIGSTISSVVHDMNNPISCILSACYILQASGGDESTVKMARLIRDAVDRMATMTTELIDFSRGETHLKLDLVSVPEFVRQLEPDFARCRIGCTVEIKVEFDGSIQMDRHRMLRVFGNLIKNAREAMGAGERNVLKFVVRSLGSAIEFQVSDTGHGIKKEFLPKIFEPFVTHGKNNGTGLGLAITKTVVDAHGGLIEVDSSEAGTTFRVTLPIQTEERKS